MRKNNESKKGMKTLYWASTIETGIYTGEMVHNCLRRNGKKAILELLKYYNFSEDITREYKFHVENPRDLDSTPMTVEPAWSVSSTTMTTVDTPFTSTITNEIVNDEISEDALDYADSFDNDFSEWLDRRNNYKNSVLYDPEDDVASIYSEILLDEVYPYGRGYANALAINY